jgi:hypothetical protein
MGILLPCRTGTRPHRSMILGTATASLIRDMDKGSKTAAILRMSLADIPAAAASAAQPVAIRRTVSCTVTTHPPTETPRYGAKGFQSLHISASPTLSIFPFCELASGPLVSTCTIFRNVRYLVHDDISFVQILRSRGQHGDHFVIYRGYSAYTGSLDGEMMLKHKIDVWRMPDEIYPEIRRRDCVLLAKASESAMNIF